MLCARWYRVVVVKEIYTGGLVPRQYNTGIFHRDVEVPVLI